ncbi:MAG: methyltransferase [Pseudomonadota bacterium]|nr:methyltransferase [Pseudomonadota bacterium]
MIPTTRDALLGGRVRFLQAAHGYRVAIDPVILAAAAPVQPGQRVLDAGCGAGAAGLCLLARVPDCRVTGIEVAPEIAAIARRNATINGFDERMAVVEASVTEALAEFGPFDHVIANPPYNATAAATMSPNPFKAQSHSEGVADLSVWIGFARRMLRSKGTLALIHRAERMHEVIAALEGPFGGITLIPLWPHAGEPAKRIVIRARLGTREPARIAPGLVLHEADGRFTEDARAILEDGASLDINPALAAYGADAI